MPKEITIAMDRYEELLLAEKDAERLARFLKAANSKWSGLSSAELAAVCDFFFPSEED